MRQGWLGDAFDSSGAFSWASLTDSPCCYDGSTWQDNTCLATAIASPVFMVDVQQVWTVWGGPGVTGVYKTQLVGRLPAWPQPRSSVDVQRYGVGWRDWGSRGAGWFGSHLLAAGITSPVFTTDVHQVCEGVWSRGIKHT